MILTSCGGYGETVIALGCGPGVLGSIPSTRPENAVLRGGIFVLGDLTHLIIQLESSDRLIAIPKRYPTGDCFFKIVLYIK